MRLLNVATRMSTTYEVTPEQLLEDHLILEYKGPLVQSGRMDSRRVASQIVAFSDFLEVVSQTAFGQRVDVRTEIQGFRGHSFDIDFLFHVAGHVATMLSSTPASPKDVIDLIKNTMSLWKHLGGKPPKAMNHAESGAQLVVVENNYGQIMQVSNSVINVVSNPRAGEAVEKFVRLPLETNGLEAVAIRSPKHQERAQVEKRDAGSFMPVPMAQSLGDVEIETHLVIESPTFKDGNKWKFSDGQTSFFAKISDAEFLQSVDDGSERFGKGDTLKVRLRIQQESAAGRLSAERTVTKVLDHYQSRPQGNLF